MGGKACLNLGGLIISPKMTKNIISAKSEQKTNLESADIFLKNLTPLRVNKPHKNVLNLPNLILKPFKSVN